MGGHGCGWAVLSAQLYCDVSAWLPVHGNSKQCASLQAQTLQMEAPELYVRQVGHGCRQAPVSKAYGQRHNVAATTARAFGVHTSSIGFQTISERGQQFEGFFTVHVPHEDDHLDRDGPDAAPSATCCRAFPIMARDSHESHLCDELPGVRTWGSYIVIRLLCAEPCAQRVHAGHRWAPTVHRHPHSTAGAAHTTRAPGISLCCRKYGIRLRLYGGQYVHLDLGFNQELTRPQCWACGWVAF